MSTFFPHAITQNQPLAVVLKVQQSAASNAEIKLRVEMSKHLLRSEEGSCFTCIWLSGIECGNANDVYLKHPAGTCIKVDIACRYAIRQQNKPSAEEAYSSSSFSFSPILILLFLTCLLQKLGHSSQCSSVMGFFSQERANRTSSHCAWVLTDRTCPFPPLQADPCLLLNKLLCVRTLVLGVID